MAGGHFVEKYARCEHVGAQCRCPAPDKTVRWIPGWCPACRAVLDSAPDALAATGEDPMALDPYSPPHGTPANPLAQRTLTAHAVAGLPSVDHDGDWPPVLLAFTTVAGAKLHVRMHPDDWESFADAVVRNRATIRDDLLK
jgi:hypothetical protein